MCVCLHTCVQSLGALCYCNDNGLILLRSVLLEMSVGNHIEFFAADSYPPQWTLAVPHPPCLHNQTKWKQVNNKVNTLGEPVKWGPLPVCQSVWRSQQKSLGPELVPAGVFPVSEAASVLLGSVANCDQAVICILMHGLAVLHSSSLSGWYGEERSVLNICSSVRGFSFLFH